MIMNYLEQFKDLRITKEELSHVMGGNLLSAKTDTPVIVYNTDVVNVLNAYKNEKITSAQLLDWVNTVWFTELFDYDDKYSESIASVLDKLEELDEEDKSLSQHDIDRYNAALLENREV